MSSPRYEPAKDASPEPLAQQLTFTFSKRTAPNRLMNTSKAEMLATWHPTDIEKRGIPTEGLIRLYSYWSEGGWGIISTGNIQIDLEYLTNPGDAIIPLGSPFEGERFEAYKKWAAAAKQHGSLMIGQVVHPGRQVPAKLIKEGFSASAVPFELDIGVRLAPVVRAATQADIDNIVAGYAHAAAYLEAAGFDGIELHAAHGYLLAQFLSSTTNQRTDGYGGSLRNRMRLINEVCGAIRARVSPSFIVGAKLNSVEFQAGGITPEEAAEMCAVLQGEMGLDFVELSGGTYEELGMEWTKESTRRREAFFIEFAKRVVPALGGPAERKTKVYLTGGLRSRGAMVAALDVVDAVGIGRPATQEPRFAKDIIEGRIKGAIKPMPPFDNSPALSLMTSGTQMHQLAHGFAPFDLSDPKAVEQFSKDMTDFVAAAAADGDKLTVIAYPVYAGEQKPYA